MNGTRYLQDKISLDDYVMIQYGAAPFTSEKILSDVIRVMKLHNDGDESRTWVNRDSYIQIACPYGFQYGYLLDIYKRAEEQGLIDKIEPHTTSLMYALGDVLYQAYGDQTNIKITTKEDLALFEGYALLQAKRKENKNVCI